MASPNTLTFVLLHHGGQFIFGLASLLLGLLGWMNFTPDPPDAPYQTLTGLLGPWPYVAVVFLGAVVAGHAWWKGYRLRHGG